MKAEIRLEKLLVPILRCIITYRLEILVFIQL